MSVLLPALAQHTTLRMGLHYHVPAFVKSGKIFMPGYLGRFVDSLAIGCDEVVCFFYTPNADEEAGLDYAIQSPRVKLVEIGLHSSIPKRTLNISKPIRAIKNWRTKLDVMLIRGPSPLLPVLVRACGDLPTVLLLVGDYLAGIYDLPPQPFWRKKLIHIWCYWNKIGQNRAVRSSLVFVNSQKLYNEYKSIAPHLIETRTTTLTMADFYEREDTCQSPPYHLLYTGRITRAKGLLDILDAVEILVQKGIDVVFDLVGPLEKGDPVLVELTTHTNELGITERVQYHGYRPVGAQLFAYYRQADIYIIASKSSEGFPRTIWEAMAHSLPVIATNVGSIPDFIEGAAEIVPPRNPTALARAIHLLTTDSKRRQMNIQRGLELARKMTLEAQVPPLLEEIKRWIIRS